MSDQSRKRPRLSEPGYNDLRLEGALRELMDNRKYVKQNELTAAVLLEHAKFIGAVTEVDLVTVTVRGALDFKVSVENGQEVCGDHGLKAEIQDQEGVAPFQQVIFRPGIGNENPEKIGDRDHIKGPCTVSLSVAIGISF